MTNIIFIIHNLISFVHKNQGSSLLLPAYGRVGQGQHFFLLAVHFAKRNTKNCGGEKARAGREFLSPQPPFLPALPERWGGKRLVLASARKQSPQKLFP